MSRRPTATERRALTTTAGILEQLHVGAVHLRLPDGRRRTFGDRGSALQATIEVHDWGFGSRLVGGGSVGLGESYMAGEWTTDDLVTLVRVLIANRRALRSLTPAALVNIALDRVVHTARANRLGQAQRNVAAHYDLSNELYALFLDESMTYSSAYFTERTTTLEDAQEAKYRRLAQRIHLDSAGHVLEIGCGWGGFASFAARTYGCRVTAITLSERQASYARQRIEREGLASLVDIRVEDYRQVHGSFDRVVSIEMLEAVGHRYLGAFFGALDRLLAPNGLVGLQVITIPERRYGGYRRRPDFIQRYIFPGGHLPSLTALGTAMGSTSDLFIEEVHNLGMHYAETLHRWRARFLANRAAVHELGFDATFVRMWDFYLAYCEAAFVARYVNDLQIVLTRPMNGTLGGHPYQHRLVPVDESDLVRGSGRHQQRDEVAS